MYAGETILAPEKGFVTNPEHAEKHEARSNRKQNLNALMSWFQRIRIGRAQPRPYTALNKPGPIASSFSAADF
jgi:hypothetical protein